MRAADSKKMAAVFFCVLILCAAFTGCGSNDTTSSDDRTETGSFDAASTESSGNTDDLTNGNAKEASRGGPMMSGGSTENVDFNQELTGSQMDLDFTDREKAGTYETAGAVSLTLDGSQITADKKGVTVSGSTATITKEGVYLVTGTLENGQIVVNTADTDKVQLVLCGTEITCGDGPAIDIEQADKVFVTLKEGSQNVLTGNGNLDETEENTVDGVIFSRADLALNGSGSLTVKAENKHGIVSKDDLVITGGTYTIDAAEQCLMAKDQLNILDGDFTMKAGESAVKAKNEDDTALGNIYLAGGTYRIEAEEDALHATGSILVEKGELTLNAGDDGIHADADTVIRGGTLVVEQSEEGLEGLRVVIEGGKSTITSRDDGINAAGSRGQESGSMQNSADVYIKITGGEVQVNAGGDGLDSNGSLLVSGGTTLVSGPTSDGNSALDYNGGAKITGGILLAAGSSGMVESLSDESTQCSITWYCEGSVPGGTKVTVSDEKGEEIYSFTPEKEYSCVIVSLPDLEENSSYKLTAGTEQQEVTVSSVVTTCGTPSGTAKGQGGRGEKGGMGERPEREDGQNPMGMPGKNPPQETDGKEMPALPETESGIS